MKKLIPILTLTALLCPLMQAQEGARASRPQLKDSRKAKTEQVDWASIKKRIEGAVERGDMTREQANQKYSEIKKKLTPPVRQHDVRPSARRPVPVRPMANRSQHTALGRVVGELVAQNKINRDDARRILEAAHGTPPVQNRPPRDQQHGATEELRDTLNAAKRELAMLREAREHLMGQHNDQKHRAGEDQEKREHMEREQAAHREEMNRDRERAEWEKNRARAQAEIPEQVQEQRERAQKMRQEAEGRLREISEQSKKLEERRRALQDKKKKEQEE